MKNFRIWAMSVLTLLVMGAGAIGLTATQAISSQASTGVQPNGMHWID